MGHSRSHGHTGIKANYTDLRALAQCGRGVRIFLLHIDLHQRHTGFLAVCFDHQAILRGALHDESNGFAIDLRNAGEREALSQAGRFDRRGDGFQLERRALPQRFVTGKGKGWRGDAFFRRWNRFNLSSRIRLCGQQWRR